MIAVNPPRFISPVEVVLNLDPRKNAALYDRLHVATGRRVEGASELKEKTRELAEVDFD